MPCSSGKMGGGGQDGKTIPTVSAWDNDLCSNPMRAPAIEVQSLIPPNNCFPFIPRRQAADHSVGVHIRYHNNVYYASHWVGESYVEQDNAAWRRGSHGGISICVA